MNIEFWSDIICPWCGLMDHRLRRAVDRFEHGADVRITHRSFLLHPDLPREGVTQRQLFGMFGVERATGEQVVGSIEKLAAAEGLSPYHALDRTLGPTDFAHELLAYATDQGRGDETWSAMFRVHFGQARKLWTSEQVLDFAEEVHLDRDGAAEALQSRRYRTHVAADQRAARRLGAHGTPFMVLDGRYSVPGAVGTDELHSAMAAVWREGRSTGVTPLLPAAGADGVCTPDGCATSTASGN